MTALLELTVYFTVWTLITVVVGAAIRKRFPGLGALE